MAITRKTSVTQEDLESVVAEHGVPLAQIAREADIDRIALSKFRNHGQKLKLADARALLEWMRKNDLWDEDKGAGPGDEKPIASIEIVKAKRFHFPVDDAVSDDTLSSVLATIRANDKKLADLLTQEAKQDDGFLGSGEFTEETLQALRDSLSLLACNYLMVRAVSGWLEIGLSASNANIASDKVLSVILASVQDRFEAAGLLGQAEVEIVPADPADKTGEGE